MLQEAHAQFTPSHGILEVTGASDEKAKRNKRIQVYCSLFQKNDFYVNQSINQKLIFSA